MDLVDRGKMIDGKSYPYSPSLAGAQNIRSLPDDAMAAVANATAPRQWPADDLKAVTERAIKKLKGSGRIWWRKKCRELANSAGDVHSGSNVRHTTTSVTDCRRTPSGVGEDDPRTRESMVVNWSIPVQLIDQLPMAVVVVNCPPLRGH